MNQYGEKTHAELEAECERLAVDPVFRAAERAENEKMWPMANRDTYSIRIGDNLGEPNYYNVINSRLGEIGGTDTPTREAAERYLKVCVLLTDEEVATIIANASIG